MFQIQLEKSLMAACLSPTNQRASYGGHRGIWAHTGLLQFGDVQQGPVLGAAQGLLQALQAHGKLLLSGAWASSLQSLLQTLRRGCCAAQQPVEGAEQGSAQPNALLCFAVTATGKGRKICLCSQG